MEHWFDLNSWTVEISNEFLEFSKIFVWKIGTKLKPVQKPWIAEKSDSDRKWRIKSRMYSKRKLRNKSYVTYGVFYVIFSDKFSTKESWINKQVHNMETRLKRTQNRIT